MKNLNREEKLFIRLYNDGYLEETISLHMNLTEVEYEIMHNRLVDFLE